MADDFLYSTTIDRRKKGRGFVNILAHDPVTKQEEGQAPAMEPLKHFMTEEDAASYAADKAQREYEDMRQDPNSQWYAPDVKSNTSPKGKPMSFNDLPDLLRMQSVAAQIKGASSTSSNDVFDKMTHRTLTSGAFADAHKRLGIEVAGLPIGVGGGNTSAMQQLKELENQDRPVPGQPVQPQPQREPALQYSPEELRQRLGPARQKATPVDPYEGMDPSLKADMLKEDRRQKKLRGQ